MRVIHNLVFSADLYRRSNSTFPRRMNGGVSNSYCFIAFMSDESRFCFLVAFQSCCLQGGVSEEALLIKSDL